MAGASSQSYTVAASDVGRTTFQFGGRAYSLADELGRPLAQSDVGHVLTESYTPDGWVLSLA